MRLGYFGDGVWAHNAFDLIQADTRFTIAFVCVRNDSVDTVLAAKAKANNIDLLSPANINSKEFIDQAERYECELFVSMSYNQIFKKTLINLPPKKTINCHAGKLPFYRGRNILNWALINDEKEFGITVHYIDEGIDTGDIILQKSYPITDDDTYASLLQVAQTECASLLYESLQNIQAGKVNPIVQETIHPTGFYCGMRTIGDEILSWNQDSRTIFNFVRAISNPGPNARCRLGETEVHIIKAEEIKDMPKYIGTPGQILSNSDKGILVKTKDTAILITEYVCDTALRVGSRLK